MSEQIKLTPNKNCKACKGEGIVTDYVPWGATSTAMETLCNCILDQLEEGQEDFDIVLSMEAPTTNKS